MPVQTLIYSYLAICLSMIVFNCFCIVGFHHRDKRLTRRSSQFSHLLTAQLEQLASGQALPPDHQTLLQTKLRRVGNLQALDETLQALQQRSPEQLQPYLDAIAPVFSYLILDYRKKELLKPAYLAYFLAKYRLSAALDSQTLLEFLYWLLQQKSLYCRENALRALYASGSPDAVMTALNILDREPGFFHSKILSDGLLSFAGQHEDLIRRIWQEFACFTTPMQVSLLNYIRFQSGGHCARMLALLQSPDYSCEVHFAAIRYLGRYPYPPAYAPLLELAQNIDDLRWEYAAISLSSLAAYPSDKTIQVLKDAMGSSNWYIRYNASQSLDQLGVEYLDLLDILGGKDRYAREMLEYRLEVRRYHQQPTTADGPKNRSDWEAPVS